MKIVIPALHEIQQNFYDAIFHQHDSLYAYVTQTHIFAQQRIQIYRNNIFVNHTTALKGIYPIIIRLVGDDFFTAMAREYLKQYPSRSGNLIEFGEHFPEFVMHFPPAQDLPYLPEVAVLEWAEHQIYHAPHSDSFDFDKLRAVPSSEYENIQFVLHSASRLLAFEYPILQIYKMCQTDHQTEESISLKAGGDKILVIRRQLDVSVEKLTEGEFTFLSALNKGLPLHEAVESALHSDPEMDFNVYLQHHLLHNTIVSFAL